MGRLGWKSSMRCKTSSSREKQEGINEPYRTSRILVKKNSHFGTIIRQGRKFVKYIAKLKKKLFRVLLPITVQCSLLSVAYFNSDSNWMKIILIQSIKIKIGIDNNIWTQRRSGRHLAEVFGNDFTYVG